MALKKVLVLGVGAQGSAATQRLDEDPQVSEIICADRSLTTVESLVKHLTKAKGIRVGAADKDSIVEAARGADLILNALPLEWTKNVLDAALEVGANYQDYAATTALHEDWVESIRILYDEYGPKFEAIGKTALIGTGSAPGLICAATRDAMRYLDTCDTIYNIVWEGVDVKRFLPFWWSPVTALHDMSEEAYAVIDGNLVRTPAFGLPIRRKYSYMDKEITFVEHCHDEPVHYHFNREKFFKGVNNVYFKYAGAGIDFSLPLYRAGLLSHEKEMINGVEIAPFDVVYAHVPPAPRTKEEIKEIIDEGLISDSGCMAIEAYGTKDGKNILVETHVSAPGLVESFEKAGISAEMYLTGQGGYLFTKMLLNDKFDQRGLISSDMLTFEQVDCYFDYAKELDITLSTTVKEI
ncbi:MAG: saccharopine dehydrogenase NADP-binding domain-containing protein [Anaerovoracaceae bacterium]